jgi:polyhydroxyalkanoate synthesis regulator phasin
LSDQPTGERGAGLPEGLRTAIERTLAATASTRERAEALVGDVATPTSSELRERAEELLDEVARLGQQTSQRLADRGREAREAVSRRVETMRPASENDFQRIVERLDALERRITLLEDKAKPEVEG